MKFLLTTFSILYMVISNAQIKQTDSIVTETLIVKKCSQVVKGEVRDKINSDLLSGTIVILSDHNGNAIETQLTKEDATFTFIINCETTYKLEGKRADFTPESKFFTTSNEADKVLKLLISLGKGDINFVFDSRAEKKVEKVVEEIEEKTEEIKPEKIPDVLPDNTAIATVDKGLNPIYFDYDSSYLTKEAKSGLQLIVDAMKENPKMIIQCAAHTDAKGPDSYNEWMADRRAKRTVDYLINNGINANRISGKGFGATQLFNHCGRDVVCTDGQQAKNRRTEFVVIKS